MSVVLLVILVFIVLAMAGLILMQKTESGGFGAGSNSGSFMSVRGSANFFTRTTAILAALFMGLSLVIAMVNRHDRMAHASILEAASEQAPVSEKDMAEGRAPVADVPTPPKS